jgi:hypothetical protein
MFQMLLGHLCGDFLMQTEWMAMNKSKNTKIGWLAVFVHCILYTFAICLFMWNFQLLWIVAVFFSHFFIDKFSLAEKYMHYIKGKGMKDYVNKHDWMLGMAYMRPEKPSGVNLHEALEGGFTAIVYTLTDNTMHLILMWGAYKLLY